MTAARCNRYGRTCLMLALLGAALALPAAARAQAGPAEGSPFSPPSPESIDAIFARFSGLDSPGCALGVYRAGDIVYSRGYGMASLEHGAPLHPASILHVASVSKQFTVAAIALLAADGLLSLDDDIRVHLPEVADFGHPITIRHLIHHTSGLRDQWELLTMAGWRQGDPKSERDILDLVTRQRELNFTPGERYLYSNTGYTLMAVIVHRVSGRSLRDFADARIFRPLGMLSTHFHDDHTEVIRGRTSAYVSRGDGAYRLSMPIYDNIGATSLNTTVEDLAKWDANFYEPTIGGQALLDVLHRQGVLNAGDTIAYAGALMINSYRELPVVEHSGADAGFRAQFMRFPGERLSVAVLCNVADSNPGQLARQVADVFLGDRLGAAPTPPPPPAPSAAGAARSRPADAAAARDYIGSYYSAELDVHWRIAEDAGELVLRRRRFPDVRLIESGADELRGGPTLRFTRGADGAVDGFAVSGNRVLNLRFERVPE